jgi:O-antigen/teichoic acid export membrane protein
MRRELRFKELSLIRVLANLAEFAGKVGFAAAGFGVWCFVLGPLCRVFVTGIGTQICMPWRPRLHFKLRETWSYASFGMKASSSQILYYFYTNVDYPIVGYFFGNTALGIYRTAYEFVLEPVKVMSDVIRDVSFSAFSRAKGSRAELIEAFVGFTRVNLVAVMSYVALVFVTCDDVLYLLWREKYLAAAPAIRILSLVGVLRALSFVAPPLLDGMGRPGRTLVYQLTAAVLLPISYVTFAELLGPRLGFRSVAVAWAVGYPIAFAVLAAIALVALELPVSTYLRRVGGIPICVAAAAAVAGAARLGLGRLGPAPRFGLTLVAFLLPLGLLLATTQKITPRSIARAMAGKGPPGEAG